MIVERKRDGLVIWQHAGRKVTWKGPGYALWRDEQIGFNEDGTHRVWHDFRRADRHARRFLELQEVIANT